MPLTKLPKSPIQLPCTCANLRRAARAVTRVYNQGLRRDRIEITQFTLLMTLDQTGETSQGVLGQILALDSTTLTRMLGLLRKRGWVEVNEGDDRRRRLLRLTPAGRAKLQKSLPHWKRAQERLQASLGETMWKQLGGLLTEVTRISMVE